MTGNDVRLDCIESITSNIVSATRTQPGITFPLKGAFVDISSVIRGLVVRLLHAVIAPFGFGIRWRLLAFAAHLGSALAGIEIERPRTAERSSRSNVCFHDRVSD